MVLKVGISDFYQNYGTWLPKVVIILTMKLMIGGSLFWEILEPLRFKNLKVTYPGQL
jgi:hypothetical protein